jgi:secreted trypsin-like serine protease
MKIVCRSLPAAKTGYAMCTMKKVFLLVAAFAVTAVGAAQAITNGQVDGTGHPNVGAMVWQSSDGKYHFECSGSLVAPSVFLTASHCTAYVQSFGISDAYVTFDPTISTSNLLHGTMVTNPLYNQTASDPEDIAVIVLDQPVSGITPVQLPPAGLLDQMKDDGTLNGTLFTSVGYGTQQALNGPGGHTFPFDKQRRYAVGEFNALTQALLKISQNGSTGDGGTCYGDSGGPQFLGAGSGETPTQVSITLTGDTPCKATNVDYRLDTPQARAFLAPYVTLP